MNSHVPVISRFAKLFIAVIGLMPTVASAVVLIRSLGRPDSYLSMIIFVGTLIGTVILAPLVITSLSTKFSADGVRQISFFTRGRLFRDVYMKWGDVERYEYKGMAFYLYGAMDKVVVNLTCFNNSKGVAAFVRGKLLAVWCLIGLEGPISASAKTHVRGFYRRPAFSSR